MRSSRLTRSLIGIAWVSVVAACGGAPGPGTDPGSYPDSLRPLQLVEGDRWIGNAISYGPYRDGQSPGGVQPTATELRQDLHLMAPHWNLLRIYGSTELSETLLKVIRADGFDMKVMVGAWIAADADLANRLEVDAAIRLANEYPDIVRAVCVGNETQVYWSAHRSPVEKLIEHVRRVREAVEVPVTVADDYAFWDKPESRAVAAELDFITLHAHPMWNGTQLEESLPWLQEQLSIVQAMHPDRPIVIGETGWATMVHDEGEQAELIKGQPGEDEQKQFYVAVRDWAARQSQPVFFFEAFDENWKGGPHPNEVEKHWGLFRADRTSKAAIETEVER